MEHIQLFEYQVLSWPIQNYKIYLALKIAIFMV